MTAALQPLTDSIAASRVQPMCCPFRCIPQKSYTDMQPEVLGDVVISVETAARQAERAGCALWEEMSRLLVHGILHLLGFDHENNAVRRARHARPGAPDTGGTA